EHTIEVSKSGLLTIAGGKWTTYRKMAEDAVDHAATLAELDERPCITKSLTIHGSDHDPAQLGDLGYYGSDADLINELMTANPELSQRLDPALPIHAAQVVWSVRHEMTRTVDDVLARRTRALFLNAKAAIAMAPAVARLMAEEMGRNGTWERQQ